MQSLFPALYNVSKQAVHKVDDGDGHAPQFVLEFEHGEPEDMALPHCKSTRIVKETVEPKAEPLATAK